MTGVCEILLPATVYRRLEKHLFPGDGMEHGAVVAVSTVSTSREIRLLGQRLFCARDGIDYVNGVRSHRRLEAGFVAQCLDYCRANGLGYLAVHNHGGADRVAFSATDLASHERGYPTLLTLNDGAPVGALVFARNAAAGDIWFADGTRRPTRSVRVIDSSLQHLTPEPPGEQLAGHRFHRQLLMFGALGQARLRDCRVAIVGLGGVGSILVELVARLGVGTLLLVDPDRLTVSNLSRVVAATRWDARWPFSASRAPRWLQGMAMRLSARKTTIAARVARRANPDAEVVQIAANVASRNVARSCRDCDFVFLAADSMQARLTVNALVQQYLIPGLQVGSKIVTGDDGHRLEDAYSVVRWLLPGRGCLWCNGLISPQRLAWEAKTERERRDQEYGVAVPNPSVITLNALGAAHAASRFMHAYLGLSEASRTTDLRIHPITGEACHDVPRHDLHCPECGVDGRLAQGDALDLPTLVT